LSIDIIYQFSRKTLTDKRIVIWHQQKGLYLDWICGHTSHRQHHKQSWQHRFSQIMSTSHKHKW